MNLRSVSTSAALPVQRGVGAEPVAAVPDEAVPDEAVPDEAVPDEAGATGGRRLFAAVAVDQAVCSLTNFALTLVALRTLNLAEFGAFSLVFGFLLAAVYIVRSLCIEPLVIEFALAAEPDRRRATSAAVGASLLLGMTIVAGSALSFLMLTPAAAATVVLVAVLFVPLLIQDGLRHHWLSGGRAWRAAGNDFICLIVTTVALVVLSLLQIAAVPALVAAWSLGAAAGAAATTAALRVVPHPGKGMRWILEHRRIGLPLAGSALVAQGAPRLCLAILGSVAGLAAVGSLGAAMAVLAPINVAIIATGMYGAIEVRRRISRGAPLARFVALLATGPAVLAALVSALALLLPDRVGIAYLGVNWQAAQLCLIPVTLWVAATGIVQGPRSVLRGYGANGRILALTIVTGLAQLAGTFLGAWCGNAVGAAWGIAAASALCVFPWLVVARRLIG